MPLEATMICVDNSDFMRNGDYLPTRIEAQQDCASTISNRRLQDNPESTVGLLSMAGKDVELMVPPTTDSGKVLAAMGKVKCGGTISFITSLKIAMIALNHVKNKNGGKRVIAFVGSPIEEESAPLQKLAKLMKKNNIGVDIVSIGEKVANEEKLTAFVNEANSSDNSSLVMVTAGTDRALDEILMNPSLGLGRDSGFGGGVSGGGGDGMDFDPEMDPEMAMALRISAEESRATAEAGSGDATAAAAAFESGGDEDDEAMMQRALAMSMASVQESRAPATTSTASVAVKEEQPASGAASMEEHDDDMDEELAKAMALSMESGGAMPPAAPAEETGAAGTEGFLDPDFVREMLGGVDLDPNDPLIQAALAQGSMLPKPEEKKEDKEGGKKRDAPGEKNN